MATSQGLKHLLKGYFHSTLLVMKTEGDKGPFHCHKEHHLDRMDR